MTPRWITPDKFCSRALARPEIPLSENTVCQDLGQHGPVTHHTEFGYTLLLIEVNYAPPST
jgi:hypothetical protein